MTLHYEVLQTTEQSLLFTWEKLYDLFLAAAKRKTPKPDEPISRSSWTVWTGVLHDPVHFNIVGFKNYIKRQMTQIIAT